jgi:hypothetical protein
MKRIPLLSLALLSGLLASAIAAGPLRAQTAPATQPAATEPAAPVEEPIGPTLALTDAGESRYAILIAPDAPETVKTAAAEMQTYLEKIGGATIEIVAADERPDGPVISLGATCVSRAAGHDPDAMELEHYRIVAEGRDLLIFGPDTPDGQQTATEGYSAATLHGVYAFLEEQLDVRWLFPGELGEDFQTRETIEIPSDLDVCDGAVFPNRVLTRVDGTWRQRQRLYPDRVHLRHNHNFRKLPLSWYDAHPEYFPLIGGRRTRQYQLDVSNPEVAMRFAQVASGFFDKGENRYSYSLSSADVMPWGESRGVRALTDPNDPRGNVSYTPLLLHFYNSVARRVAPRHPDRILCGYAYADHLFPPADPNQRHVEDNLYIMIAYSPTYGWKMVSEPVREIWHETMATWAEIAPGSGYYDLPANWFPPLAPCPSPRITMKTLAEGFHDYGIQALYLYGCPAWTYGGAVNYMYAQIMKDPTLDVDAVQEEYFNRMYGPKAGPVMCELNDYMADRIKKHVDTQGSSYRPTPYLITSIYGQWFGRFEELYLKAESLVEPGSKHEKRLKKYGDGLALLRWLIKVYSSEPVETESTFDRSEKQILQLIADAGMWLPSIQLPGIPQAEPQALEVELASDALLAPAPPQTHFWLDGPRRLLLQPLSDGPASIRLKPEDETLLGYRIQTLEGETVREGISSGPIRFEAAAEQPLLLDVACSGRDQAWSYRTENLAVALRADRPVDFKERNTTPYFYVPQGVESFKIGLAFGEHANEEAYGDVISPTGKVLFHYDTRTSAKSIEIEIPVGTEPAGFWAVTFNRPPGRMSVTSVIRLDESLPGWICTDPEHLLIVRENKTE